MTRGRDRERQARDRAPAPAGDLVRTRRFVPARRGAAIDLRAHAARRAAARRRLDRAAQVPRAAPQARRRWWSLCDISGSMARYTRMFLHFLHAITNERGRVHRFTFGTRLTNVTRALRYRDADIALATSLAAGGGLVRRHAHRPGAARVQQQLVAAGAGPGRRRLADHRRARPRGRRRARRGDGAAAQILPPPDLAEPALALRRLRAASPQGIRGMLPHVDEFRAGA